MRLKTALMMGTATCFLAAALGAATPSTPALARTTTQVAGITMTLSPGTLTGTQTATLTVHVHLVDPDGVAPTDCGIADRGYGPGPCLYLTSFDASGNRASASTQAVGGKLVHLSLDPGGTLQDGTWSGTAGMGAVDTGTWRPTQITAGDLIAPPDIFYNTLVPLPKAITDSTAVTLKGRNWPILSLQLPAAGSVRAGQLFTVRGTVRLLTTRTPVKGALVRVGWGICGPLEFGRTSVVRTNAAGAWSLRTRVVAADWCGLWGRGSLFPPLEYKAVHRAFSRATVTTHVGTHTLALGHSSAITGVVAPATDPAAGSVKVVLQRFHGGSWHQVDTGLVSFPSGRYRLLATPPRGTWAYRVSVPAGYSYTGALGHRFSVTAR